MVCSVAPPAALVAESVWLGTGIAARQLWLAVGILLSVILAVAPRERQHLPVNEVFLGVTAGLFSSMAQGIAASCNRVGFRAVEEAGLRISPMLAAWFRITTGMAVAGLWVLLLWVLGQRPFRRPEDLIPDRKVEAHPAFWLVLSAVMGPVMGITMLMLALQSAPAALVQAVIATLPVFVIPVAWILDGTVPSKRSLTAGTVAIGLTVVLVLSG